MNAGIWWLWEGAAVRERWSGNVGKVYLITEYGVRTKWVGASEPMEYEHNVAHLYLDPKSNPAVMFAPEGATHVDIGPRGDIRYRSDVYEFDYIRFMWPQCPDHLKGHTWELPKGEKG